jgi:hypothetical protein
MQLTLLGKVSTIPELTGNIYLGGRSLNQATLQGAMIQFNAPAALGPPNQFMLTSEHATNSLRIAGSLSTSR